MNYVYTQYIEINWSVLVFQELSAILSRLDKIENKLDQLLQSGSSFQGLPPKPTSRGETPSPAIVKEVRREWIKSRAYFKECTRWSNKNAGFSFSVEVEG